MYRGIDVELIARKGNRDAAGHWRVRFGDQTEIDGALYWFTRFSSSSVPGPIPLQEQPMRNTPAVLISAPCLSRARAKDVGRRLSTYLALLLTVQTLALPVQAGAIRADLSDMDKAAKLTTATTRATETTKGDFIANNNKVWSSLLATCSDVDDACANAAIFAASSECEDSAKFFRKGTKGWQIFSISLTLASAAFTGVGASATLANAKVFSTLGGSTGLAALVPTLNANATGDQAGMVAVSTTLSSLQAYARGTAAAGTAVTPPENQAIFQQARIYGALCAAAANASPATNSSAPKPTGDKSKKRR